MKTTTWKRIFAVLLTVLLTVSGVHGTALATEGEDPGYERTDSYVINYAKTDMGSYEAQAPYLYASPHMGSVDIRNLDNGQMEGWITSQQVYNLINTTKLAEDGTGAYASIEAYCTDACINASSGHTYQRANLEDCTFYDDTAAGRIRAIFLHSFPYIKDMAAIEASVNDWLASSGTEYSPLSNLTGAEAITATQIAIWAVAGGTDVEVGNPYYYTDSYTAEELDGEVVYAQDAYVNCMEEAGETTANNIRKLYDYLMALDIQGPAQKTISNASFLSKDMEITADQGTYTVTVTTTVNAIVGDSDSLTLTASLGDQQLHTALTDGQQDYTFTFINVTDPGLVTLEINGYQTVADVFLFDANGDRSASQSMVGYDDSRLPVHTETIIEPDRILNFYKTTIVKEDTAEGEEAATSRIPLENIQFDIYYLCSLEDYIADPSAYPEAPTAELVADLDPIATVKTDAAGNATYNLTNAGQPDGLYLIVERENPAIVSPAAPFYVAVPMTDDNGENWTYTINIEPKNNIVTGPVISKDVTEIDNDKDTFDVDEIHTWIIRGSVPVDIANALDTDMVSSMEYIITDTLDYRLTYQGNVAVKVGLTTDNANEENVTLAAEDYVLDKTTAQDGEGRTVDHFTVSLTASGLQKVATTIDTDDYTSYEIRVYFDASINSNASMAENIPNQATLDYTNSVGFEFDAESDIPVVYTGGMSILKYDARNASSVLPGAVFKVARPATQKELDASLGTQLIVGGQEVYVVYVDFYTDTNLTTKATQVTTDANGKAILYGLAYGEYYLVETKAPEGYNLLTGPVKVTIDKTSHTESSVIRVANSNEFQLPNTGDSGTTAFTVAGTLLILSAAAILVIGKKRKAC